MKKPLLGFILCFASYTSHINCSQEHPWIEFIGRLPEIGNRDINMYEKVEGTFSFYWKDLDGHDKVISNLSIYEKRGIQGNRIYRELDSQGKVAHYVNTEEIKDKVCSFLNQLPRWDTLSNEQINITFQNKMLEGFVLEDSLYDGFGIVVIQPLASKSDTDNHHNQSIDNILRESSVLKNNLQNKQDYYSQIATIEKKEDFRELLRGRDKNIYEKIKNTFSFIWQDLTGISKRRKHDLTVRPKECIKNLSIYARRIVINKLKSTICHELDSKGEVVHYVNLEEIKDKVCYFLNQFTLEDKLNSAHLNIIHQGKAVQNDFVLQDPLENEYAQVMFRPVRSRPNEDNHNNQLINNTIVVKESFFLKNNPQRNESGSVVMSSGDLSENWFTDDSFSFGLMQRFMLRTPNRDIMSPLNNLRCDMLFISQYVPGFGEKEFLEKKFVAFLKNNLLSVEEIIQKIDRCQEKMNHQLEHMFEQAITQKRYKLSGECSSLDAISSFIAKNYNQDVTYDIKNMRDEIMLFRQKEQEPRILYLTWWLISCLQNQDISDQVRAAKIKKCREFFDDAVSKIFRYVQCTVFLQESAKDKQQRCSHFSLPTSQKQEETFVLKSKNGDCFSLQKTEFLLYRHFERLQEKIYLKESEIKNSVLGELPQHAKIAINGNTADEYGFIDITSCVQFIKNQECPFETNIINKNNVYEIITD